MFSYWIFHKIKWKTQDLFRKIQLNKPTFSYSFLFHILLTTPTHTHLPPSPRLFFS